MVGQFSLFAVLAVAFVAEVAYAKPPQKIVGGDAATQGEFPYMASLRLHGGQHCGAAIISNRHVITAAHCVTGLDPFNDLTVVTGSVLISSGGQTHRPSAIRYHREYTHRPDGPNDLAIIALASPMTFNANQQAARLPATAPVSGQVATVTGWGYQTRELAFAVDNLRKLNMKIMDPAECQSYMTTTLYTHQVCAVAGAGRGTCHVDSGGPLAMNGVLIGVVSYGLPCATGSPDVFSSVYHYSDWIREVVSKT